MLEAKSAIVVSCEKKIKRDPFFRGQLELSSFEFRGHLRTIQDPLIISLLFKVVLRGQIITYIRGHSRTISYLYWKVRGQMRTFTFCNFAQEKHLAACLITHLPIIRTLAIALRQALFVGFMAVITAASTRMKTTQSLPATRIQSTVGT